MLLITLLWSYPYTVYFYGQKPFNALRHTLSRLATLNKNYLTETRIFSGIRKNQLQGNRLLFITLTSSNEARCTNINNDFQILKKRIIRKYLKDDPTSLQYCKVHTNEGNGVLHIVMKFKPYLPHQWLRSQWYYIHKGTDQINIQEVRDAYRTSRYIVSHYLGSQKCSYSRYSSTDNWITSGYSAVYSYLQKRLRDEKQLQTTPYGTSYHPVEWGALTVVWESYIDQISTDDPPTNDNFLLSLETYLEPSYEGLTLDQIIQHRKAFEHNKWVDANKSRWASEMPLWLGEYHFDKNHPLQTDWDPDFDKKYLPVTYQQKQQTTTDSGLSQSKKEFYESCDKMGVFHR